MLAKRRRSAFRTMTLAAVFVLLAPSTPAGGHTGAFYPDVPGHWAEPHIRVLWEEGVTPPATPDGSGGSGTWTGPNRFYPDSSIQPFDFGDWLTKAHPGGPFPPPEIALRLAGTLQSSFLAGQSTGGGWVSASPSGGGSLPPPVLLRQEAVAVLVEALGLGGFASSLDPTAADAYLRQFHDTSNVAPEYRLVMALAIRLRIVEGYPDRTLQPRRALTRAEGATLLYRCCLLLADASPNPFSPDGDGAEDRTTFRLGSLRNRNAQGWSLSILDSSGGRLRSFGTTGAGAVLPDSVIWDGRDSGGRILPAGTYYYRGWLRDRNGLIHYSALKPVVIEEKTLTGNVHPRFVVPGAIVRLSALATGGPTRVTAFLSSLSWLGPIGLSAINGSRDWRAQFVVPAETPPGRCVVTFVADYPGTTRTAQAWFDVRGLGVTGTLDPNPARAGERVQITAWTNQPAEQCTAAFHLPAQSLTVFLTYSPDPYGRHGWTGNVIIPAAVPSGRYAVVLAAKQGLRTAKADLWLDIRERGQELTFIISD
jgi:hypothetical protein